MSRLSWLLLALVIIFIILGGIGLGVAYFNTKTLQGTVADASGAPLAQAAVTLAGRSTFADAQGNFELQIPQGTWELNAFADGFQPLSQTIQADEFLNQHYSTQITLQPREWHWQVVASDTNQPIPNAHVEIDKQSLTTDAQGDFVTRGIRNGTKIKIQQPGYRAVTVTVQTAGTSATPTIIKLTPAESRVTVVDASSNQPLPGVRVTSNGQQSMTDVHGQAVFTGLDAAATYSAQAPGYVLSKTDSGSDGNVMLQLAPTSLQGHIIAADKTPVPNALILLGNADGSIASTLSSDAQGNFTLDDFSKVAKLYIKKPGYALGAFDLKQGGAQDFALMPFQVKGIHLYYGIKREDAESILNQLKGTEMNAVVFDVKEAPGYVLWDSKTPLAQQIGAYVPRSYTANDELATCKTYHLYCIARVTVMKDVLLAKQRPDLALHDAGGGLLYENDAYWMNPAQKEVQDYHIGLAQELVAMGFDEVQFDYIRYPGTRNISANEFGDADYRVGEIKAFLNRTGAALRNTPAFFSGDVFGLTTAVTDEQGIGQVWEDVAPTFDYVSPMMYPSTWRYATDLWGASFGIKNCSDAYVCPYDVIRYGTVKAEQRTTNGWTLIRPWIQAYGMPLDSMLAQAQGADDGSNQGYLFWNNQGIYPDGLFKKR